MDLARCCTNSIQCQAPSYSLRDADNAYDKTLAPLGATTGQMLALTQEILRQLTASHSPSTSPTSSRKITQMANLPPGTTVVRKSQYQHYIPRFLLKHFAPEYSGEGEEVGPPGSKYLVHSRDDILDAVFLAPDTPSLIKSAVKKTFGQDDMYEQKSLLSADQWNSVEKKLGKVETAAGMLFKMIRAAHIEGSQNVVLDDGEYVTIMKFVFIIKYRSTLFFDRYNHQLSEDYTGNDKAELVAYMHPNELDRLVDVWLNTIAQVVDLEMVSDKQWHVTLAQSIHPEHAAWAELVMRRMYPVICTSNEQGQEFVLSEHAYALQEGPNMPGGGWIEFHIVCVIVPQIALLLRSDLLPDGIADTVDNVRIRR